MQTETATTPTTGSTVADSNIASEGVIPRQVTPPAMDSFDGMAMLSVAPMDTQIDASPEIPEEQPSAQKILVASFTGLIGLIVNSLISHEELQVALFVFMTPRCRVYGDPVIKDGDISDKTFYLMQIEAQRRAMANWDLKRFSDDYGAQESAFAQACHWIEEAERRDAVLWLRDEVDEEPVQRIHPPKRNRSSVQQRQFPKSKSTERHMMLGLFFLQHGLIPLPTGRVSKFSDKEHFDGDLFDLDDRLIESHRRGNNMDWITLWSRGQGHWLHQRRNQLEALREVLA